MKQYKKLIRITLLVLMFMGGGLCSISVIRGLYSDETKCGTVTFKGEEMTRGKYSHLEHILVVEYPTGKEDVRVSLSTWSSTKVGDNICFAVDFRDKVSLWVGMAGIITLVFLFVLSLIAALDWLFEWELYWGFE